MIPTMVAFDTEAELNDFLNSLGVPCQPEEPKKESKPLAYLEELYRLLDAMDVADCLQEPKQETTPGKQPLTGGSVNYYTVKVKGQPVECGDVMDALQLTPNEYNIFKEIWRTANARLGNGKPGHTALYGAEKVAYYANRILAAEQAKA